MADEVERSQASPPAARIVRPYALTAGRTRSVVDLPLEATLRLDTAPFGHALPLVSLLARVLATLAFACTLPVLARGMSLRAPVAPDAANATDAVYTVSYEGGSQAVTVNQRVNGGQWTLLGSFPFNAGGSGYKVDLAYSPNDTVVIGVRHGF